jgi:hypothetical protein
MPQFGRVIAERQAASAAGAAFRDARGAYQIAQARVEAGRAGPTRSREKSATAGCCLGGERRRRNAARP